MPQDIETQRMQDEQMATDTIVEGRVKRAAPLF